MEGNEMAEKENWRKMEIEVLQIEKIWRKDGRERGWLKMIMYYVHASTPHKE